MPLQLAIGHASSAGKRARNEDFVGMVTPSGEELARKGALLAIADGVSGHEGGREAAEYAVRGLLTDYYATPDTWDTSQALDRVLKAINRWIISQAQARREVAGMATTLTALVLRGRRAVLAHVGDTRCYRWRDGQLTRLTTDHVWDRPDMSHVLTRGMGLDPELRLDISDVELRIGDRFVLLSDGVWSHLRDDSLIELAADCAAEPLADRLVQSALAAGSTDNVSAIVADVCALPDDTLDDVLAATARLPVPDLLKAGDDIDGFAILEMLGRNTTNVLYKVRQLSTGRLCVLKTLLPERASDLDACRQLAYEEWIARRMVARFFPQVIPVEGDARSALYYVQTWHAGTTLAQTLESGRHLTVPDVLAIATQLTRAVGALHRRSVIHRDIKPENVHLSDDNQVRVLDFGVAESGLATGHLPARAGTPSYLAPEQFTGAAASAQTDLYALGVTLYYALTRRYPYGEIEAFQRPRFGEPQLLTRYRPDTPQWLENVVLKAVARDPAQRFETAEEMLLALERGATQSLPPPAPTPLLRRDPLARWRALAITMTVINLLLLYSLLLS